MQAQQYAGNSYTQIRRAEHWARSSTEWVSSYAQPPQQGGMGGSIVNRAKNSPIAEELRAGQQQLQIQPEAKPNLYFSSARRSLDGVCKYCNRTVERKTSSEWYVPADVWALVLNPPSTENLPGSHNGASTTASQEQHTKFEELMTHMVADIQAKKTPPLFDTSTGIGTEENNNKIGPALEFRKNDVRILQISKGILQRISAASQAQQAVCSSTLATCLSPEEMQIRSNRNPRHRCLETQTHFQEQHPGIT